jgi:hypothetical protein
MAANRAYTIWVTDRLAPTSTSDIAVAKPDQSTQPVFEFDSAVTAITLTTLPGGLTPALTATPMNFYVLWRATMDSPITFKA